MSRPIRLTTAQARKYGVKLPKAPKLPSLPGSDHTHTWAPSGRDGAQCTTCLYFTSLDVLRLLGYALESPPVKGAV